MADLCGTAVLICYPIAADQRWIVADVLIMAAFECGPPVTIRIEIKTDYRLFHRGPYLMLPSGGFPPDKYRKCDQPADPRCDHERHQLLVFVRQSRLDRRSQDPKLRDIDHYE